MQENDDYGVYVNPMDFPINFRALWLPGNPAIQLMPGQTISGPHKYLSAYRFFMPVRVKMHKVSSITVDQDGSYRDIGENCNEVIHIQDDDVIEVITEDVPKYKVSQEVLDTLPLDFGDKRIWLGAKPETLLECCDILGIEVSNEIHQLNNKKKKWELVRLIKEVI